MLDAKLLNSSSSLGLREDRFASMRPYILYCSINNYATSNECTLSENKFTSSASSQSTASFCLDSTNSTGMLKMGLDSISLFPGVLADGLLGGSYVSVHIRAGDSDEDADIILNPDKNPEVRVLSLNEHFTQLEAI